MSKVYFTYEETPYHPGKYIGAASSLLICRLHIPKEV